MEYQAANKLKEIIIIMQPEWLTMNELSLRRAQQIIPLAVTKNGDDEITSDSSPQFCLHYVRLFMTISCSSCTEVILQRPLTRSTFPLLLDFDTNKRNKRKKIKLK